MSQNASPAAAGETGAAGAGAHGKPHSSRRKMVGRVISAKMQKTVVVEVVTHRRDPLYGKYVPSRARYKVHDEKGELRAGGEVEVQEHRPISRQKRWIVIRVLKKFVEE